MSLQIVNLDKSGNQIINWLLTIFPIKKLFEGCFNNPLNLRYGLYPFESFD